MISILHEHIMTIAPNNFEALVLVDSIVNGLKEEVRIKQTTTSIELRWFEGDINEKKERKT